MYQQLLHDYEQALTRAVRELDAGAFEGFIGLLCKAYQNNRQVFIMGNGGSAATANHFVCDFGKNAVQQPGKRRFRILSLSDNVEKITALGNDFCFEEIFRQQLINLMQEGDLLIAVSASGNSPNLLRACEYAKEKNGEVVALSGFGGGKICNYADVSFATPLEAYEQIEDWHLIILHMVVCFFKQNPHCLEAE